MKPIMPNGDARESVPTTGVEVGGTGAGANPPPELRHAKGIRNSAPGVKVKKPQTSSQPEFKLAPIAWLAATLAWASCLGVAILLASLVNREGGIAFGVICTALLGLPVALANSWQRKYHNRKTRPEPKRPREPSNLAPDLPETSVQSTASQVAAGSRNSPANPSRAAGADLTAGPAALRARAPADPQRKDMKRRAPRPSVSGQAAYEMEQGATRDMFIASASVIGATHDQEGCVREDAFALAPAGEGLVLAVADGLGSTALAHVISRLAAGRACQELLAAVESGLPLEQADWHAAADELVRVVSQSTSANRVHELACETVLFPTVLAGRTRKPIPATTLALAAAMPQSGGTLLWWLTVGDCEIVIANPDLRESTYITPRYDHSNIVGASIPSAVEASSSGLVSLRDDEVAILMTDGYADVFDRNSDAMFDLLLRAKSGENVSLELAQVADQRVGGYTDDRTFAFVGHR